MPAGCHIQLYCVALHGSAQHTCHHVSVADSAVACVALAGPKSYETSHDKEGTNTAAAQIALASVRIAMDMELTGGYGSVDVLYTVHTSCSV